MWREWADALEPFELLVERRACWRAILWHFVVGTAVFVAPWLSYEHVSLRAGAPAEPIWVATGCILATWIAGPVVFVAVAARQTHRVAFERAGIPRIPLLVIGAALACVWAAVPIIVFADGQPRHLFAFRDLQERLGCLFCALPFLAVVSAPAVAGAVVALGSVIARIVYLSRLARAGRG